jgi:ParB-like chromosome segregation protein Spo0J
MSIKTILEEFKGLLSKMTLMDPANRITLLNEMKKELNTMSPFKDPVDVVQWTPIDKVVGNDYNPNKVAPPEMKLLELSVLEDGYTQPIVAYYNAEQDQYIIVDGFHRLRVGKENKEINNRILGYVPIVVINKPIENRIASTIRHNRARGRHAVSPMSDIVASLVRLGWDDKQIGKELGMDADEVLRLKQRTGLPEIFKDHDFSKSWVAKEIEDIEQENLQYQTNNKN